MERGDLTGAILDGRYRVLEPVAEGAMGVVYRAERVKLGRIVAIKVLHDVLPNEMSARKRFEIEAMAMAKLEHPHCASVLDVGLHGDRPFVVMDFVRGENLRELITQGPVPIPRATEIVRQVLSGLAHAHELGIIHRDIKPANLALSQKVGLGDHVKILDFGLARLHDTGQNLTTGLVVGTPAYMAPEQIRGLLLDHRVDLYACGVLLFELLTGHKPFHSQADDPIEVCKMHLSDPVPRLDAKLPGVDFGELEAVVAKALAKQRDDRYASAQAYAAALDAVVPHRPSVPPVPSSAPISPVPPRTPAPPTEAMQITSADVMSVGDVSRAPTLELRSADVMSAIASGASQAGAGIDPRATTVAVGGHGPGPAFAPPGDPAPASPGDPAPAPAADPAPAPRTFFGIAVTPPSGVARRPMTSPSGVAPLRAATPPSGVALRTATPPPGVALRAATLPPGVAPHAASPESAPARPATWRWNARWKRRWLIVAGGIAVVAILAAILFVSRASRGRPPASDGAGVASGSNGSGVASGPVSPPDPSVEIVAQANDLVAQGAREAALELLSRSRRQYPDSALLPFAAGRIYFSKFYWTEGLRSFRDAIRNDPAYRTDPELIKTVLRGFLTTPSYNSELASFLREDIGSAAKSYLQETVREHPNAAIRSRAASELQRYR